MKCYVGLDVSQKSTEVCVIDEQATSRGKAGAFQRLMQSPRR